MDVSDVGTVRREDHEDVFSLWLGIRAWNATYWGCVYSTDVGNIGCAWPRCGKSIENHTVVTGRLPGLESETREQQ